MLKPRIVLLLTFRDGQLCRTKNFRSDRWYSVNFVELGLADEIVCLDVTPQGPNREAFRETVCRIADQAMVPVTVGGYIRSVEDVAWCLREMPAEKVVVSASRFGPWTADAASRFGCQAIVGGVTDEGTVGQAVDGGAGEILFQVVERDGSLEGYDLDALRRVLSQVRIPVVAGSGCGTWDHMKAAFDAGASGAATSVIHHLTGTSLKACKTWLSENGVGVRT